MKRIILTSPRIGDENLFYGVVPSSKGIMVDAQGNGDVLSISDNGWGKRKLAKSGISGTQLSDPNYYSTDTWMPAPEVDFNNDTTLKLGEELICTVLNISSHLSHANPNNDMVYTWVPDGVIADAITGVQVRLNPTEDVTWEVYGVSATLGTTESYVFSLSIEDTENPIPLIQTITGDVDNIHVFKILNHVAFTGTVIRYEIYDLDPDSPIATTVTDTMTYQMDDEIGIKYMKIRAVVDGVPTESRTIPIITSATHESTFNYKAFFVPIDKNTRISLSDFTGFGDYGNKGYFEVRLYTEDREIELVNITGAKLIKSGVYFDKGIIEVEFNETDSSYPITFEYLMRKKGTVGGIRYSFSYDDITTANQTPYDFRLLMPTALNLGGSGTLTVVDEHVKEYGYYQFTLNADALSGFQITGTTSTRFDINTPIDFTTLNAALVLTITVTIYDLLDQVVKVISVPYESNAISGTIVNQVPEVDQQLSVLVTGLSAQSTAFMEYNIPVASTLVSDTLNQDGLIAFDIFDINNPSRLTNRLNNYGFKGSAMYPHELYRDTDVVTYLTADNPQDSMLSAYRKVNLALDISGDNLVGCDSRVTSSGTVTFNELQSVRQGELNIQPDDGIYIGNIHTTGQVTTSDFKYGLTYNALHPTIIAISEANPDTTYKTYLVGPGRVIMLMLPVNTTTGIPALGRTVIKWTDASHLTPQYLVVDPDIDIELQGTEGLLNFDGDFTYRALSISKGTTIRTHADSIQGL